MTDKNAAEVLRILAGMRKDIGEALIETATLHSAIAATFPESAFLFHYSEHIASEIVLRAKRENERLIGELLEKAGRLSKA